MRWDASSCKGIPGRTTSHGVNVLQEKRCTHCAELGPINHQFLWWIIITHLCLPSLKIFAWWPAGTYTEKALGQDLIQPSLFRMRSAWGNWEEQTSVDTYSKRNRIFGWPFFFLTGTQKCLCRLFFSNEVIFVTLLFQLSAIHVSEAVPYMHGLYIGVGFGLPSLI